MRSAACMAKMRRSRVKNKLVWAFSFLCICLVFFVLKLQSGGGNNSLFPTGGYGDINLTKDPPRLKILKKGFGDSKSSDGQSTNSQGLNEKSVGRGCRLPELRVDDPAVKHLFYATKPLKCAREKNWIYVRNGTFYIDPEAVKRHGDTIKCDYTNFWRKTDFETMTEVSADFANGSKLRGDFFKVNCASSSDGATYSNVHAAVAPSPEVIKRCRSKELPQEALGLNVYMVGFDSISRMTFMRKLPKTYKYLTETMKAIVLKGYNIVGDGTPQALIPILTGKTETELPLTRKRFRNAQYVNVYPWIWNEFREAGYATMYGEDAAWLGTFTYRLKGFDEQPTDHYMRTFYTVAEGEAGKHPQYCWGSEPHHKVHFGYAEHFWESYPSDIRKFAFQFHSVLSHNDINDVGLADDDMVRHLQFFTENGHMNNTIIIFMADHGHRFNKLRETQEGKLEERLPFFSFAFPPWFMDKYPSSMKAFQSNADRLTTPFDIHATFQSILNFDPTPKMGDLKNRSLSLFDWIPPQRGCADAGIEPHWCACLDWTDVSPDNPSVQHAAKSLVQAINMETERERKSCVLLRLHSITRASMYSPATAVLQYRDARDRDGFVPDLTDNTPLRVVYFQVTIRTQPGNALYEASLAHDRSSNELIIDLDSVSHINKYGDLPHCIIDRDYFLAKWCVCPDKVGNRKI